MPARPARGFMQPDPGVPAFDWSRDGVACLWLVTLILGLLVWIGLLEQGGLGRR